MAPIPSACSGCRRPFVVADPQRRLVLLEGRHALCNECEWRASHPESALSRESARSRRPVKGTVTAAA